MAYSNELALTEVELAGRWVAVYGGSEGSSEGIPLSSGAVVVDYDTELDLLCQRVAAAGQSGLTIYRYPGQLPAQFGNQGSYLSWPGPLGHA